MQDVLIDKFEYKLVSNKTSKTYSLLILVNKFVI